MSGMQRGKDRFRYRDIKAWQQVRNRVSKETKFSTYRYGEFFQAVSLHGKQFGIVRFASRLLHKPSLSMDMDKSLSPLR
jgi:hypothetical protein